jgi:hypothetical protein
MYNVCTYIVLLGAQPRSCSSGNKGFYFWGGTGTCVSDPNIRVIKEFLIGRKFHCHEQVFNLVASLSGNCSSFGTVFSRFKPCGPFTRIARKHPTGCFGMSLLSAGVTGAFKFKTLVSAIASSSSSSGKVSIVVVVVASSGVPIRLFWTFVCPMSRLLAIVADSIKSQKCDFIAFFSGA